MFATQSTLNLISRLLLQDILTWLQYPPNGQFAFWLQNNQYIIVHMSIPDNSHLKKMV